MELAHYTAHQVFKVMPVPSVLLLNGGYEAKLCALDFKRKNLLRNKLRLVELVESAAPVGELPEAQQSFRSNSVTPPPRPCRRSYNQTPILLQVNPPIYQVEALNYKHIYFHPIPYFGGGLGYEAVRPS